MKSIASFSSLGRLRRRALVEQRRREVARAPSLSFGSSALPARTSMPHADDRLLVVQHRDHLQAVRQRPHLVGRELHLARRQRPRRPFRRPGGAAIGRGCCRRLSGRRRREQRERGSEHRRAQQRRGHRPRLSARRPRRRHQRQHQPVLGGEIGPRHALHVGRRDVLEDLELAVGGGDVVVDDRGVRQLQRLLLVRLAAEDVVARELVLGRAAARAR